jgi:hypothetical protein
MINDFLSYLNGIIISNIFNKYKKIYTNIIFYLNITNFYNKVISNKNI